MPRPYLHLGRGAAFKIKTREEVLSLWLSGYEEEEIAKYKKIEVKDIKEIIAFQETKFGDDFKKLRKWRQKQFVEKAWKTIHVAQDVLLEGLKNTDKYGNYKTTPSMASNIIVAMKDKLKEIEGKEETDISPEEETRTPEEEKDLADAVKRIKEKEIIDATPADILLPILLKPSLDSTKQKNQIKINTTNYEK